MVPIRAAPIPIGDGMRVRRKITATVNQAFVIMDKEWMTLISNLTANGDHIVTLKGGNVPFVLGKKPDISESDIRYQLVSDAYVHGIMNG
jgi:hypothetical protein